MGFNDLEASFVCYVWCMPCISLKEVGTLLLLEVQHSLLF